MPRSSRAKQVPAAPPVCDPCYLKRAMPYHSAAITIMMVVFGAMFMAVWLVLLAYSSYFDKLERVVIMQQVQLAKMNMELNAFKEAVGNGQTVGRLSEGLPAAATSVEPTVPAESVVSSVSASPSGQLKRGSLSPDGTKYAGYEETTKGKIGIAVEMLESKRIRYIVIFNPYLESTGAGTQLEPNMSVRWVDDGTIEYDVLVKRGSLETKETQTVKIFF